VKLQSRFKINTWHALPKCAYSFCSFSYNQENPGPSGGGEDHRKPFKRRDGAGLDTAIEYKRSVALYFCLVARNAGMEFNLATNVKELGAFGDVVFKLREKGRAVYRTCYLHVRYNINGKPITDKDLAAPSHHNNPLSLETHFKSHETIKTQYKNGEHPDDSFENCHFIIYTNCELQGHSEKKWKRNDPLKILNTSHNGSYVTFDQGSFEFNKANVKNPKKGKEENTNFSSFLNKVKLFQCQTNLEEVEDLIKEELRKASGTSSDTEWIYQEVKQWFDKWCRQSSNVEWISETSLLKQIRELYIETIESESKRYEAEECKGPGTRFTEEYMGELFNEWHKKKHIFEHYHHQHRLYFVQIWNSPVCQIYKQRK
jgi:hypothetical protein